MGILDEIGPHKLKAYIFDKPWTLRAVARELRISPKNLRRWLRANGWERPSGRNWLFTNDEMKKIVSEYSD